MPICWILTAAVALFCIMYLSSMGENIQDGAPAFIQGMLMNDPFYPVWFDQCHPERHESDIITAITTTTTPEQTKQSNCLDIGCGTGSLVGKLSDLGYATTGIDSSVFLEHCRKAPSSTGRIAPLYPNQVKAANLLDYRRFDAANFSHIVCPFLTIYQFDATDKKRLLSNCYYWLKPGGTLVVYLFRDIPAAAPVLSANSVRLAKDLDDESTIYSASVSPLNESESEGAVTFTQTFTNKTTYMRLHDRILFIDSLVHIVNIAESCGFHILDTKRPFTSDGIVIFTKQNY